MAVQFDLLGDPIPEGRGSPGRTGHVATSENARRIRVLLAAGMGVGAIAQELGISAPTLRKHYFANGKVNTRHARKVALSEMRARNMLRLDAEADKGNVSAMKALDPLIQRAEREILEEEMGKPEAPKEPAPGLKRTRELHGFDADDALDAELAQEVDERLH